MGSLLPALCMDAILPDFSDPRLASVLCEQGLKRERGTACKSPPL